MEDLVLVFYTVILDLKGSAESEAWTCVGALEAARRGSGRLKGSPWCTLDDESRGWGWKEVFPFAPRPPDPSRHP